MKTFFILTLFSSCYIISYGQNNYPVALNNHSQPADDTTTIMEIISLQFSQVQ